MFYHIWSDLAFRHKALEARTLLENRPAHRFTSICFEMSVQLKVFVTGYREHQRRKRRRTLDNFSIKKRQPSSERSSFDAKSVMVRGPRMVIARVAASDRIHSWNIVKLLSRALQALLQQRKFGCLKAVRRISCSKHCRHTKVCGPNIATPKARAKKIGYFSAAKMKIAQEKLLFRYKMRH